jgi:hypothetical protein
VRDVGRRSAATLLTERSDLVVLKLDDPLLPLIGPAQERGKQNVVGPEGELHWNSVVGRKDDTIPGQDVPIQSAEIRESEPPQNRFPCNLKFGGLF